MKKKIFLLISLVLLSTMLTSCIGIYWSNEYKDKNVRVHLKSTGEAWIAEVGYIKSNGDYRLVWDDGYNYDYRCADARASYGKSYDTVLCKIPEGNWEIIVTVMFNEGHWNGKEHLTYQEEPIKKNVYKNKLLTIDIHDDGTDLNTSARYSDY